MSEPESESKSCDTHIYESDPDENYEGDVEDDTSDSDTDIDGKHDAKFTTDEKVAAYKLDEWNKLYDKAYRVYSQWKVLKRLLESTTAVIELSESERKIAEKTKSEILRPFIDESLTIKDPITIAHAEKLDEIFDVFSGTPRWYSATHHNVIGTVIPSGSNYGFVVLDHGILTCVIALNVPEVIRKEKLISHLMQCSGKISNIKLLNISTETKNIIDRKCMQRCMELKHEIIDICSEYLRSNNGKRHEEDKKKK